jgi:xylan 1,4-beta-xylosidase
VLVQHWVDRYGLEAMNEWLFEVWNEPNLTAFWTGTRDDYLRLYDATARAIKRVAPSLRVGGPATADNAWIETFVAHCETRAVPVDFVSTHHYPTDAFGLPGDDTITQLAKSRRSALRDEAEVARGKARGKPLYYTEWSTSSNPFDPLHDQPYAAAFIAKTALEASGIVQGYSYWTFSDIFEENYFSSEPFHGGFGLMNVDGVPKPAYRAYELLHRLGDRIFHVEGVHPTVDAWVTRRGEEVTVLLTNGALPRHRIRAERVHVTLDGVPRAARAFVERIDDEHANAKQAWIEMGRPHRPSPMQVTALETASALVRDRLPLERQGDLVAFDVTMPPRGTALITLTPRWRRRESQRGAAPSRRAGCA